MDRYIVCPHCGREYNVPELTDEELNVMKTGGPCPSDDCPGHDDNA